MKALFTAPEESMQRASAQRAVDSRLGPPRTKKKKPSEMGGAEARHPPPAAPALPEQDAALALPEIRLDATVHEPPPNLELRLRDNFR